MLILAAVLFVHVGCTFGLRCAWSRRIGSAIATLGLQIAKDAVISAHYDRALWGDEPRAGDLRQDVGDRDPRSRGGEGRGGRPGRKDLP